MVPSNYGLEVAFLLPYYNEMVIDSLSHYPSNPLFYNLRLFGPKILSPAFYDYVPLESMLHYFPRNNLDLYQGYSYMYYHKIQDLIASCDNGSIVGPSHTQLVKCLIHTENMISNFRSDGIALSNSVELSSLKLITDPLTYTRREHLDKCMALATHWHSGFMQLEISSWNVMSKIENCNTYAAYMGGHKFLLPDLDVYLSNIPFPMSVHTNYHDISSMDLGKPI